MYTKLKLTKPNKLTQKFLHLIFTHVNVDIRVVVIIADYSAGSGEAQGRLEQQEQHVAPGCPEGWKRPSEEPGPATPRAPWLLLPQHHTFTLPLHCFTLGLYPHPKLE